MSEQHDVEHVMASWQRLTGWLAAHAPLSYAGLLPPAAPDEIAAAEEQIHRHAGHGLPAEVKSLWSLCGGLTTVELPEDDEDDEDLNPHGFIPGGSLLTPSGAVRTRMRSDSFVSDPTPKVQWVPFLGEHWEGGVYGAYVDASPAPTFAGRVGLWSAMDGLEFSGPWHESIAGFLDTVTDGIVHGAGPLVADSYAPGIAKGCLSWDDPRDPGPMQHPDWRPVH